MASQGATLQNYNNELVTCIEDLRSKREEVNKSIAATDTTSRQTVLGLLDIYGYGYPVWFHEGMAELYAVHRITPEGSLEFGIVPGSDQVEGGFGGSGSLRFRIAHGRGSLQAARVLY